MAEIIPFKPRRLEPQLLAELISIHSQCVHAQEGKCGLAIFVQQLCWEINQVMGCPNAEDRAFKRHDEMCAARPIPLERILEGLKLAESMEEEPE